LNIDIAAQTVGNLNVNIAASSATITVSGSVSITGTPSVTISGTPTVAISGTVAVSISAGSVTISSGVVNIGRNAPIDIGSEATDRASSTSAVYTSINKDNPANSDGLISSVEIWANTNLTGCKVGIFYKTNGNTLKCRSATTIGAVTAGSKQTFSGLSLEVRAGDYIGLYAASGKLEFSTSGYQGNWYYSGDACVVGSEQSYDFEAGTTLSFYGFDIEHPLKVTMTCGATYVNSQTATSDAARRFETTSKNLRDVIITVKTYAQLFGDSAGQTYPVAADGTFSITQIDISTLYFKNATAGQNGTVHILAVND